MSLSFTRSWLLRLPNTRITATQNSQRSIQARVHFDRFNRQRQFSSCRPVRHDNTIDQDLLESIESHRPKGKPRAIADKNYQSICSALGQSFTVPQLRLYLKTHSNNRRVVIPNKARKADLLRLIVSDNWGFPSREMVQQAELKRKRDTISSYFKTTKQELFFIIGDEGTTLRNIEQANDVHITILVDAGQYIIEGLPKNVAKAHQDIKRNLTLIQEDASLASQLKEGVAFEDVVAMVMPIIPNVSKQSGTFISTSNDKFTFTSLSHQSMDQAKLLMAQALSELDVTKKSSLGAADYTFVDATRPDQQLEFVPVHDSQAMSLTSKPFGWSRVRAVPDNNKPQIPSPGQLSFYNILGDWSSQNEASGSDIKALLNQQIGSKDNDTNIHLEARFGAVLYQNPKSKTSPMLETPRNTIFNAEILKKYTANASHHRRLFFGMQPPSNITAPLLPVTSDHGVHRRSVVLEYVNRKDLVNLGLTSLYTPPNNDDNNTLQRIRVEFLVQEDGSLLLEKAEGERKRAMIDLITLAGNVDVRLLAKKYIAFNSNDMVQIPEFYSQAKLPASLHSLVDQCELTGYSDFYCPPSFDLSGSTTMDLLEVSFRDEARYMADQSLVTVSDIDAQYSQARRTELTVTPVKDEDFGNSLRGYLQPRNGLDGWDGFTETVRHIAKRWCYSFR